MLYYAVTVILVQGLEARVFQAGRSLNLVLLDCPVSFPGDLDCAARLHPLFIYVQVSRPTVSMSGGAYLWWIVMHIHSSTNKVLWSNYCHHNGRFYKSLLDRSQQVQGKELWCWTVQINSPRVQWVVVYNLSISILTINFVYLAPMWPNYQWKQFGRCFSKIGTFLGRLLGFYQIYFSHLDIYSQE